jgi:circadian clock protein KaiC
MTRQGLEEYVSDCVIMLDNRVNREVSTRRLRVLKYRGSTHGTNEYPFLIDDDGITVMPITSLMLDHEVSSKRITSGIKKLDEMLGGGYYEGSSILVTGTAGTGKTNLASFLVDAACKAGNKALYIGFEESPRQIIRNARSIGIDLAAHVNKGLLHFEAVRSSSQGLEMHLAKIYKIMQNTMPSVIVVDPITNLINSGNSQEVRGMLGRMMDMFKAQNITALYTSLTEGGSALERTEYGVSSFVDTWVLLRDYEENGERNRLIYILKSRGTAHSNRVREFTFSASGIDLINVYYDQNGVLTGSARELAKLRDKNEKLEAELQLKRKIHDLENRRMLAEAEIKTNVADVALLEEEVRILQGSNQLVTPKGSALKKGVRRG